MFYGIEGIAQIFGCSVPTANRIKKSGVTMYEEGIRRYEERHGALDAEPQKKNAREILFAT